jgi:carbonic anhydrase/acetyltransferase-like protein (isoleucine patch superfamily)
MPVYAFEKWTPVVDPDAFVHPDAVLIGNVHIGKKCFIGAGAVLRGDFGKISIGDGSNVQENCVIHVSPGEEVRVEEDAIIAHGAILHDAVIKRGSVVGMGVVVLQGAVIGEGVLVAALTLIPTNYVVPPGKIVAGNPAKIKGDVPDTHEEYFRLGLAIYQELPERYRKGLRRIPD